MALSQEWVRLWYGLQAKTHQANDMTVSVEWRGPRAFR